GATLTRRANSSKTPLLQPGPKLVGAPARQYPLFILAFPGVHSFPGHRGPHEVTRDTKSTGAVRACLISCRPGFAGCNLQQDSKCRGMPSMIRPWFRFLSFRSSAYGLHGA